MTLNVPNLHVANIVLAKLLPIEHVNRVKNHNDFLTRVLISGPSYALELMNSTLNPFSSRLTRQSAKNTPNSNHIRENIRARERLNIQNPINSTKLRTSRLSEVNFDREVQRWITKTSVPCNTSGTDRVRDLPRRDPNTVQINEEILPIRIEFNIFSPALGQDSIDINIPDLYDNMEPPRYGLIDSQLGMTESYLDDATYGLNSIYHINHYSHIIPTAPTSS